ncbi:MAG TPA: patatin family protein [Clostridia bacterium]|nr:patatin family protein [Clostridia bacterium]
MSKLGLILEGGGMRGIFTAGVLDYFLEKGIEFDSVIAVSAGSCHACSFLSKQHGRAFATSTNYLKNKNYCGFYSFLKTGNLFGVDFIFKEIPEKLYPIDNNEFKKNKTTFQAVVTNCVTGEAEYPFINDMFEDIGYVRASSSLPLVSRMVEIGGKLYLDGGICDSIPIEKSIEQGNTKNVVVLTREREYRKQKMKLTSLIKHKYRNYPNLIEKVKNRHIQYNKTLDLLHREEKRGNTFIIAPDYPLELKRIEKDKEKMLAVYEHGYKQAERMYNDLIKFCGDV